MNVYEILEKIEDKLKEIENIKSCQIGLEGNLTQNQCPFIRIISLNSKPDPNSSLKKEVDIQIIFGFRLNRKEELKEVYREVYELEEKIKAKMNELEGEANLLIDWSETIPDEDALLNLKASAIIFNVKEAC